MTGSPSSFIGEWTRGHAPLWQPCWIGGFAVCLASQVLALAAAPLEAPGLILLLVTVFGVQSWLQVAIRRCAFNVGWPAWGYLARVGVVLFATPWILAGVVFAAFA